MKNVVFVHGMFMNPKSWTAWVELFKSKGYNCITPAYPFHEGEPKQLRNNIPTNLNSLTVGQVIDVLVQQITKFDEKPIIIGHSMGGLLTQLLVNKGYAKAGVCIDSAPPAGVFTLKWSFLKSNLPVINPFKSGSPCLLTKDQFRYAFCNIMSQAESDKVYDEYVVPESRKIPASVMKDGKIDFSKPHVPLLMIAGSDDNIIPQVLVESNFRKYTDKNSKTELKVFPNRSHYICGQQGWEEVAAFVLNWIEQQ